MPQPSKSVTYSSAELQAMRDAGVDQTDWKRVKAMRDEDIIYDEDAPEATEEDLAQAFIRIPIHLAPEVWQWLHDQGQDYDLQINTIIRAHIAAQQAR